MNNDQRVDFRAAAPPNRFPASKRANNELTAYKNMNTLRVSHYLFREILYIYIIKRNMSIFNGNFKLLSLFVELDF